MVPSALYPATNTRSKHGSTNNARLFPSICLNFFLYLFLLIFLILGAYSLAKGLLILPLHVCLEKLVDVGTLQLVQLFDLLLFAEILLCVPLVEEFSHA